MLWRLPPGLTKLLGMLPRSATSRAQCGNATMDGMGTAMDAERSFLFTIGTVVRSDAGWYGVLVHTHDRGDIACVVLNGCGNGLCGVSEFTLPIEGTSVFVYLPASSSKYGVVLGVVPPVVSIGIAEGKKAPQTFASMWELESFAGAGSDVAYSKPLSDTDVLLKVNSNAGRPMDVLPGTWGYQNEQGVGVGVSALAAALRAGSKAQVRVSAIDDQVRVVSGHFIHYNCGGLHQLYNDGGFVTDEYGMTPYQCERSGCTKYGTSVFEDEKTQTIKGKSLRTSIKNVKAQLAPKKRLQIFTGYLGDLINVFVAKPDPKQDPETATAKSKDQGLAHVHVDSSGHVGVRSAGGISLQRCDRIPVPKRMRQPWDPAGDLMEDQQAGEAKKGFEWNEDHPHGRSLELRDAEAWRVAQAYKRLHDQSEAAGKKDFYLPEEADMQVPDNDYDGVGKASEDFASYDKRRAGIWIEKDGSVSIRDAWGSEILMRGGSIVINCGGQCELKSGKSTVIMGGHDLVLKARQSVDITATEKDVRVKADANLHMVAEGRNKGGGILLESKAKSEGGTGGWKGKEGEEVTSHGIILKATDSAVLVTADKTHIAGARQITLDTFGEGSANQGSIQMSANTIIGNAKFLMSLSASDRAGLHLTSSQAALTGPSAVLAGDGTAAVLQGAKAMVPLTWADAATNVYDQLADQISPYADLLQGTEWLGGYPPDERGDIYFTYRTSEQYGTLSASEIEGGKGFAVYQPFWAYLAKAGSELVPDKVEAWAETEIEGTKPWPGAEAGAGGYVTLLKENNVAADTGISKSRRELQPQGGGLTAKGFDEYEVMKHS